MRKAFLFSFLLCALTALTLLQMSRARAETAPATAPSTRQSAAPMPPTTAAATSPAPTTPLLDLPDEIAKSVTLPHDEPYFPSGTGREAFVTACIVCHSPRYITMQPAFSRKVWAEEVHKMAATYGAHVTDAQAADVVEYLMLIKGTQTTGGNP